MSDTLTTQKRSGPRAAGTMKEVALVMGGRRSVLVSHARLEDRIEAVSRLEGYSGIAALQHNLGWRKETDNERQAYFRLQPFLRVKVVYHRANPTLRLPERQCFRSQIHLGPI